MKAIISLIIVLFVLTLGFMIGAKNGQIVSFNFLIAQQDMRLSSLMAIMFVVGSLITSIIFLVFYIKARWRLRRAAQPATHD